eukprot:CAMPEP_0177696644 /NCGR_PEP_ID=MMETSP0484_2-20121128/4089_1 /TAXON_ID=354590 /ORGANISM="Rhodomonas lens, Strain RHODO" /LENGTH=244 /DNA_ID=CAMNT_0019207627 /DNA_START=164 /DNA_END=898 /DNA_ORIENTATION=+
MNTVGHSLPGTGFDAMAKPSESSKGTKTYVQGSSVDLIEYYKTLEANDYEQVLIKSGSSKKARSFINLGDNFYFSGQHFWETTYQESFDEEERIAAVQTGDGGGAKDAGPQAGFLDVEQADEDEVDVEEATFRYRVIQAVVGKKRCDELEEQIRNKVMSRMAGGAGELLKCFKLFSSGKGEIGPTQLMSVVQDLGVDISRREAYALFGRFDINKDGGIVYYEFVDALLQKGENENRDMSYYERR